MSGLLIRLSFAGMRTRLVSAALTIALVAAASTTAMLAFQINRVADNPWKETFEATNGAHIVVSGPRPAIEAALETPGVAEASGPAAMVVTTMQWEGRSFGLQTVGLGPEPPTVQRPLLTDGRWLSGPGEVVLERSMARTLGIRTGDRLSLKTTSGATEVVVIGIAVIAADEPYPESQPGLAFVDRALVTSIQPDASRQLAAGAIRLSNPEATDAFLAAARGDARARDARFEDWHDTRAQAAERTRTSTIVLTTFSIIILAASGLGIATFVGARVVERVREAALLKAAGCVPAQVGAVFLTETLVLAVVGALMGIGAGSLLAPGLVKRSAELVGAVPVDPGPQGALLVLVGVPAAVILATLPPVVRVARLSTMQALSDPASAGRPGVPSLRRPVWLALGLKQLTGRPGRAAVLAAGLALAVGTFVAGLGMEATLSREQAFENRQDRRPVPPDPAGLAPATRDDVPVPDLGREQIRPIVWGLNALLLAVLVVNILASAILGVRERTREIGTLKALGLVPGEVSRSVISSQVLVAGVAALAGIPVGIALFTGVYHLANDGRSFLTLPPAWQLASVPLVTALAVAAVATIPARWAAGIRVVEALRRE